MIVYKYKKKNTENLIDFGKLYNVYNILFLYKSLSNSYDQMTGTIGTTRWQAMMHTDSDLAAGALTALNLVHWYPRPRY